MKLNRRAFLKAGATAVPASLALSLPGRLTLGTMAGALGAMQAHAAGHSDYKALVCVFLYGGMDNHDTIIPYDTSGYNQWANIRSGLLNRYTKARSQQNLLPLAPDNQADFADRQFALPPEMTGLQQLFNEGDMAVVGNVGPMLEPVTASAFHAETARLPSRLFSHNDQQATWMSGSPEGAQYGWAGLFGDIHQIQSGTGQSTFTNITTGGGELLLTGTQTVPYHIGTDGAEQPWVLDELDDYDNLYSRMRAHFRSQGYLPETLLGQDISAMQQAGFDANEQYNNQAGDISLATEFPADRLGKQLQAVARTIAAKDSLGVQRQTFVVTMGGFDTHSDQAQNLPELQGSMDQAILAFSTAMKELGLNDQVTLFTASDFGRTLAINGDGTDHGWGGHHFITGGAVQGRRIYGDIPESSFDHAQDAGNGRLIPTLSVDQYAAALGQWYGLTDDQLSIIFPALSNFPAPPALFG